MTIVNYFNEPAPLAWDLVAAVLGASGVEAVVPDPSDLNTMFQDTNGNIPIAPGSPVAMMLEKSKGLERVSVSRVPDQSMFAPAGTTPPATNENDEHLGLPCVSVTYSPGMANGYNGCRATATSMYSSPGFYRCSFEYAVSRQLLEGESAVIYFPNGGGSQVINSSTPLGWQKYESGDFHTTTNSVRVASYHGTTSAPQSDFTVYVRQIKADRILGNHIVIPSVPARPTLARMPAGGWRNFIRKSNDLSGWSTTSVGVDRVSDEEFLLTSTASGWTILTAPNGGKRALKQNEPRYAVVDFKKGTTNFGLLVVAVPSDARITVNLTTGETNVITQAGQEGNILSVQSAIMDDGHARLKVRYVQNPDSDSSVTTWKYVVGMAETATASGAAVGNTIYVRRPYAGTVDGPYQIVDWTNSFDVTEEGVPDVYYLQGDGVNSIMQTAVINGWAASGAFLACAMQADNVVGGLSDEVPLFGATGGAVSVNGFSFRARPNNNSSSRVSFRQGSGDTAQVAFISSLNKNNPFVVVGATDIEGLRGFIDGDLIGQSPSPAIGTINAPVQIGSTTQPWRFYGGVIAQRAPSLPEIQQISKYLAQKQGRTL